MINRIAIIIGIRIKQGFRMLQDIGWILLILLCPVLFIFGLRMLEYVRDNDEPIVGGFFLFAVLSTHYGRKDIGLLKQIDIDIRQLFAIEYFIGILPLSLLIIAVIGDWKNPLLMQLGAPLIALLPRKIKHGTAQKSAFVFNSLPQAAFEWRIGLGRYLIGLLFLYFGGLVLAQFVIIVPLVVCIFAYLATSFYDYYEGKEIIEEIHFRYKLLPYKLKTQVLIFHGLLLPHYLLFLWYHWSYWYVLPAVMLIAQLLLMLALFYKYANYSPGRIRVDNKIALAIFSICLFNPMMPFLFPGIVVYLIIYWKRARKNIRLYYAEN